MEDRAYTDRGGAAAWHAGPVSPRARYPASGETRRVGRTGLLSRVIESDRARRIEGEGERERARRPARPGASGRARPPKNNWQRQWGRKESGESCVSLFVGSTAFYCSGKEGTSVTRPRPLNWRVPYLPSKVVLLFGASNVMSTLLHKMHR